LKPRVARPFRRPQSAPSSALVSPHNLVPAPPVAIPLSDRPEQRVPMSRLRARVAERLVQSQSTNAILTTFNEVNMAPIMALRKQYGEKFEKAHGVRLGFMGFFVKAAVAALQKFPIINASVDGNDIVYHGYIDIGVAVGSPRGLVVPILRDADQMSFADIEKKIGDFGQTGQGRQAVPGRSYGWDVLDLERRRVRFDAVDADHQPAAIGNPWHPRDEGPAGSRERREIVIRPINYLAMSYDHRIIDGREAVLALVTMKEALEDPARLLLGV
jgi:2-oxoglutarate dehydrogenase E2 component (dihydrolipoamide succinyltransferase)